MKMRNIFFFLIFCFGLQLRADNSSGIFLMPSFSVQKESGQLPGDQNGVPMAIRLGYLIPSGFYFGMLYSRVSIAGDYSYSETSIGNSLGYSYANTSLIVSYFLTSTVDESGPARSYHRSEGSGVQVDLTMVFPLVWGISLGPMLTYKNISFNKQESTGVITGGSYFESSLYPYIALQFIY